MDFAKNHSRAGALLIALFAVAIISMTIATAFLALIPKYRSVYQGASWQEALQGAEAGANLTLRTLNQFASGGRSAGSYDWTGAGWSITDPAYGTNGERTLNAAFFPVLGGSSNVVVKRVVVDVYTRNSAAPYHPWFRIRSTARADLPGKYIGVDPRDGALRRMKLQARNGLLADPHVTRTIEVIVRPKFRFSRAITTVQSLILGTSSTWRVDSFDSTDTAKSEPGTSAGGVYPSANPSEIQSNGGIATQAVLPAGQTYGPLLTGNGATILGTVQTVGGDDPATAAHENVTGNGQMDQSRITDDFDEEISPVTAPNWPSVLTNPAGNTHFQTSADAAAPNRYVISGNLGAFDIQAPAAGATGYVEILVKGNLGSSGRPLIIVPPNVYATIYVSGDINFANGTVNADAASSKVASHLSIFGLGSSGTYSAAGSGQQILSFYGPTYALELSGTVDMVGAVVGKSFTIKGGGNGSFHYDESLGNSGVITGWVAASYFEDARTDLN